MQQLPAALAAWWVKVRTHDHWFSYRILHFVPVCFEIETSIKFHVQSVSFLILSKKDSTLPLNNKTYNKLKKKLNIKCFIINIILL